MKKEGVIIVGGGISGLMAARELGDSFEVTILEARKQLGGRIRSVPLAADVVVEQGPEFIHGRLPITMNLMKRAGIKYSKTQGRMYRKIGKRWVHREEMIAEWNTFLNKIKDEKKDATLENFLNTYYSGADHEKFRGHVASYAAGFDLADPEKVSIKSLYSEWSEEGESYRIPAGYDSLVHFLEKECREKRCLILGGDPVQEVHWKRNEVQVLTAAGQQYHAGKIIITLPVSLMRKGTIQFIPGIDHYRNAFGKIGFGNVVKTILQFNEPFWKKDTGFILSDEAIPTWWTHYPLINNLITGWAGGPVADKISHLTKKELLDLSLKTLSAIYELPVKSLRANLLKSFIFNWKTVRESLGAYSYSTPETKQALVLLNHSLEDTVFFAGEGLYEGPYPGTVEAALESGLQSAKRINALT